jgi:hypothetical protein
MEHRYEQHQMVQRVMIQAGRAGEERIVNADDSPVSFGGAARGNAPITSAARMPNSTPNVILMPCSCMAANVKGGHHRHLSKRDSTPLQCSVCVRRLTDS